MQECDYRYIVQFNDDMLASRSYGRILEEISEQFTGSGVKANVNGKMYAVSRAAARFFEDYKDSPTAAAVRVSDATGIPLSIIKDTLRGNEEVTLKKICFNSFFNKEIAESICYALMCVPQAFVFSYFSEGKKLALGRLAYDCDELYQLNDTKYVLHETGSFIQALRASTYSVSYNVNEIKNKVIYKGISKIAAYETIISDITGGSTDRRVRNTAISLLGLKKQFKEEEKINSSERRNDVWKKKGR